jgi:ABC-type branched-subunit amino acid transport system substrate-binding protein
VQASVYAVWWCVKTREFLIEIDVFQFCSVPNSSRKSWIQGNRKMTKFRTTIETLCLFVMTMATCVLCSPPSEVYLGGLFGGLVSGGNPIVENIEHLAAFMMAVKEINDKHDGVYDDILPDTTIKVAIYDGSALKTAASGMIGFTSAFNGEGVFGVVNALPTDQSLYVSELSTKLKIPMVLSVGQSGQLNEFKAYPYVSKVVALQSHQGESLQNLMCLFARTIAIFVSSAEEDIQALNEFNEEAICTLHVLVTVVVRAGDTDMSSYAAQALNVGARYYIVFMPAEQLAPLLEEMLKVDLLTEYTCISTPERGSENITHYFSPDADVPALMTGLFSQYYYSNYYTNLTAEAIGFSNRWTQQQSTQGSVVGGSVVCSNKTDGDGDHYLYQATNNGVTTCAGLDFSTYDRAGFTLKPYTALTYDATMVMVRAVDFAIKNGLDYKDALTLQNIIVENVTFDGASGPVSFFKGTPQYGYDRRGNRASGLEFVITNFNAMLYEAGSSKFMATVGSFDAVMHTIVICATDFVTCFPPIFRGETGGSIYAPPLASPLPIYMQMSSSFLGIFNFLALFLIFLVAVYGGFTVWFRHQKVIKASQPILLWCILLGGLVAAARIYVGGLDKDEELCKAEFWLGHLAFVIMIGSLFVKSYRVHCIVNTTKLRRVTFNSTDAFKLLTVIVAATVVYLIVANEIGQPVLRHLSETKSNQETIWKSCALVYPQFQTTLFALEFVLMIIAFRTCWEIRNVPDIVNESKQISTAMSAIVMVSILIMPLVYVLGLPPFTCELIASLGFGFGAIVTLILLFSPKLVLVYNSRLGLKSNKVAAELLAAANSGKAAGNVGPKHRSVTEADEMLKHKTKDERMTICQEQLIGWQARLLDEQRRAMHNSTSSQNENSDSPVRPGGGHGSHGSLHESSSFQTDGNIAGSVESGILLAGSAEVAFYVSRDEANPNATYGFEMALTPKHNVIGVASGSGNSLQTGTTGQQSDLVVMDA